jgi:tetratricopeptide (TPR) repeat protein
MKKTCLALFFLLSSSLLHAQNKEAAHQLVTEGIALHDGGEYEKAIAKYDEALVMDKDNASALCEKALSMQTIGRNEDAVRICRELVANHADYKGLDAVYVTYGNALDGLHKTDQALKVYEEGIRKFPDYYQLYFNKGIALAGAEQLNGAMESLQMSVRLNPQHASSHNAIARIAAANGQRIPALLAFCRFLALEPEGKRAKENLNLLQSIISQNVERKSDSSTTIYLSEKTLDDAGRKRKRGEDKFGTIDMILTMTTALDYDGKYKNELPAERLARKLTSVFGSLGGTSKGSGGFFRSYYAPYFAEMDREHLVDVFAHIALTSTGDETVLQWLRVHKTETDKFWDWSKAYNWK